MRIRMLMAVLLAGFMSLSVRAGFEQFNPVNGAINVFDLGGGYLSTITPYALDDVRSITTDNLTFELLPNINLYGDGSDPYWANGEFGAKTLEGLTLWEMAPDTDHELTADINYVQFNFNVDAYSLDPAYSMVAFVKVLDPASGYSESVIDSAPIDRLGAFQLSIEPTAVMAGRLLQAGWYLRGPNVSPANSNTYGSATITVSGLFANSTDTVAPTPNPMEFSIEPYALSGTNISMTASNATDVFYGVEYQFTNMVNNTSSEWQSSPTWVDLGPSAGPPTTNEVDKVIDPTFANLDGDWSAYDGAPVTPSTFVTVASEVATVTPGSAGERGFYTEFGAGVLAAGDYTWSIDASNITADGTPELFIKSFDGGYGDFQGTFIPLTAGSLSMPVTVVAGRIYQFGITTTGWTSGSYDVSSPSLTTTEVVPGASAGLTPDTEYIYMVRARDTSPSANETAWSSPVSATSTVTDVTAPTPDPMQFSVAPNAISDTAISMTASTATDDAFGVEYLFTNTVNNTSSGWQSSPSWVNVGDLALVNPTFDTDGTGWELNAGTGAAGWMIDPDDAGNGVAFMTVDIGGWAVLVQEVDLTATGLGGGDTITLFADCKALAGLANGGVKLKLESWSGGTLIGGSVIEVPVTVAPTGWDVISTDYTIADSATSIKLVLVLTPTEGTSSYAFDNVAVSKGVSLSPGTEYTYMVKARDTSPNANETAWSSPASATTTGTAPATPDIQSFQVLPGVGSVFTWDGVAGLTYDVQYTTNLVTGPWITDPSLGASGIFSSGGSVSATSTVDGASIFYQIISQ